MKRTYSRRNMSMKSAEGDSPPEVDSKRRKKEVPRRSTPVKVPTSYSTRPFAGPISIPDHDGDINMLDNSSDNKGSLANYTARSARLHSCKAQLNIHGDRRSFDCWRDDLRNRQYRCVKSAPTYKSSIHGVSMDPLLCASEYSNTKTLISDSKVDVPHAKSTTRSATSKVFEKAIKKLYKPKLNEVVEAPVPRKDILGKRISTDSPQAKLWETNQKESPLLRLPPEIKNRIFESALGGKTIHIYYITYEVSEALGKTQVRPIFKYKCETVEGRINPYNTYVSDAKRATLTQGMTLLNGICRQLYQETATLPYTLNPWSFEHHNTMANFLLVGKTLSRAQRAAIKEILVSDMLPQPNLMVRLSGLERAFLGNGYGKGWYAVIEGNEGRKLVRQAFPHRD